MNRSVSFKILLSTFLLAAFAAVASAEGHLKIDNAWVRGVPPTNRVTAAYLDINSTDGKADRLIAAASPASDKIEFHESSKKSGMASMVQLDSIEVPASGSVKLAPGGKHLMLIGLKHPLKDGDPIQLSLTFERAGKFELMAKIRRGGPWGMKHGNHDKKHEMKHEGHGDHEGHGEHAKKHGMKHDEDSR